MKPLYWKAAIKKSLISIPTDTFLTHCWGLFSLTSWCVFHELWGQLSKAFCSWRALDCIQQTTNSINARRYRRAKECAGGGTGTYYTIFLNTWTNWGSNWRLIPAWSMFYEAQSMWQLLSFLLYCLLLIMKQISNYHIDFKVHFHMKSN